VNKPSGAWERTAGATASRANPIAILAHDGEPGRSIERHRGVVCGRCRDGDRARAPMGESRARAQHGIAPIAVPAMVRMGADRLEQPASAHAREPSGRGGCGLPPGHRQTAPTVPSVQIADR
jgi:hypothetical protein